MYILSKDYEKLYEIITETKNEPIGFVDYKFSNDYDVLRDVCRIRRFAEYHIQFGVRGTQYGSVDTWDEESGKSEKELFINECKRMNLEWIAGSNAV